MKLKSLFIQNFRILEDFHVKKLGRVNLIVGKNNSGKSSVLEAIRIYAGSAHPSLLSKIASDHDEAYPITDKELDDTNNILPFESFFTGRQFPNIDKKAIVIGESEKSIERLLLEHIYMKKEETQISEKKVVNTQVTLHHISKSALDQFKDANIVQCILRSKNNIDRIIEFGPNARRFMDRSLESEENIPCSYIPTQFVSLDELADAWDKIALTEYEEQVKIALKFIENDFENIAFVKNNINDERAYHFTNPRYRKERFAKIKMINIKKPIPLNSMGDGMFRVLQLALKTFSAKGGFLLVDEFDNGLHFSVQEKIWNWIFDLAKKFDFQVFATTHSWDCVESFKKVTLQKEESEGVLFRVGRSARISGNGKVIATEFDKEKLATISQVDVEVR